MKETLIDIHFVRLATYDKGAKGLLLDEEERALENEIAQNPKAAPVITQTGGLRKIRVALQSRGKSGGARVLYLHLRQSNSCTCSLRIRERHRQHDSGGQKDNSRTGRNTKGWTQG